MTGVPSSPPSTFADATPEAAQDTPSPGDVADLIGVIDAHSDPQYVAETVSVTELVEKLSHDPNQTWDPVGIASPAADKTEDLLPDWPQASTNLKDQLPEDTHSSTPPSNPSAGPAPLPFHTNATPKKNWLRLPSRSSNLIVWISLGGLSLLAASILAMTALGRFGNHPPEEVVHPLPPAPVGDDASPNLAGRDSPTITAAIRALAEDKPEVAAEFINQLLDQGDIEAAAGVLNSGQAQKQFLDPDIAFVRGRLAWRQRVTGRGSGSFYDAQRYWTTAVEANPEFLEAWVALGFANYALGDFNGAVHAWNRAVELDRQTLQDIDPSGQLRVTSELTLYAYAGLAMANQKLGELNPVKAQQERYQQQAAIYFNQLISVEPRLLDAESLALHWLWSPDMIQNWEQTINRVAIAQDNAP
jgi:tetratricopeptide (TPR) repeat protein